MKILLPMDESEYSQYALQALIKQFQKAGTEVRVLHVVEPVMAYVTAGLVPELVNTTVQINRERLKQGQALVARAAAKLREAGFKASVTVDSGDSKSVILEHAARWNADLILLGSHGLTGVGRFLMGSVSDAVSRHAHCSVQVVRRSRRAAKSASRRKR